MLPAGVFKSCRFITIMHTRLKVPAKNSPALLFLSRGKEEERKTTTISCFSPAEEEQSRGILGGNFQTRVHDGNKAAGLKETAWVRLAGRKSLLWTPPTRTPPPPYPSSLTIICTPSSKFWLRLSLKHFSLFLQYNLDLLTHFYRVR